MVPFNGIIAPVPIPAGSESTSLIAARNAGRHAIAYLGMQNTRTVPKVRVCGSDLFASIGTPPSMPLRPAPKLER